jgi:thioredoxin-like negative regulator of GroEL
MPGLISSVPSVASDTFDVEVLQSGIPVLVEFWSEYWGGGLAMEPTLVGLAGDFDGHLKLVSLDVEVYPDVADRYEIQSLPTVLLFKSGRVRMRSTGFLPRSVVRKELEIGLSGG